MSAFKKFDVRLIERHLEQGILKEDEYQKYLEQLPDVADKAVKMEEVQPIAAKPEDNSAKED